MKKIRIYLFVVILFVLFFGIYVYQDLTDKFFAKKQKCPEDHVTSEERMLALDMWINDFYDFYPGSGPLAWTQARLAFYKENNCTASLERYEQAKSGKADPEVMERIQEELREALE